VWITVPGVRRGSCQLESREDACTVLSSVSKDGLIEVLDVCSE